MADQLIQTLSSEVVNKIAAGEVAERPSAVVKELIENSIDASARRIEIEIKDGGQKLIEVADDGVGMSAEDAVAAFGRHATSKIRSDEDLERLSTLGFRGEALASIAAVSRTTLTTRREGAETGTQVVIEGGSVRAVEAVAHARGTRLQVKNLFYNVPARRKFLKSQQAEMSAIADIVCHYILGYPELAFRLTRNNVPLVQSPGTGDLLDAVLAVHAPELVKSLLPLKTPASAQEGTVSIRGFISPPNAAKPAARYQTILINRRSVKSKLIAAAISKALSPFFPRGKYPVLILDLRLPPESVDVNVHPQKTEVRFVDERWVFGLVHEALQISLSGLKMVQSLPPEDVERVKNLSLWPESAREEVLPAQNADEGRRSEGLPERPIAKNRPSVYDRLARSAEPETEVAPSTPLSSEKTEPASSAARLYELRETSERLGPESKPIAQAGFEPVQVLQEPRILSQCLNAYLLGEDRDGLFLVDQHAAHERVLFDAFVEAYRDERIHSQPLLFPLPLKLLPSERSLVLEKADELKNLGFSIQQEEDGQFYAVAIPICDGKPLEASEIQDLLGRLFDDWENRSLQERKLDLFKMMACKAAVKAGDPMREPEMRSLFEQLLKTPNPFTCPHGRPTVIRLSRRQIETGFLRT